jgi:hypothetical protein
MALGTYMWNISLASPQWKLFGPKAELRKQNLRTWSGRPILSDRQWRIQGQCFVQHIREHAQQIKTVEQTHIIKMVWPSAKFERDQTWPEQCFYTPLLTGKKGLIAVCGHWL